jgi:hypothetical protein
MAYDPFTDTQDPYQQLLQDRIRAYGRGEQINDDLQGFGGAEDNWRQDFRSQGINAYDPILNGSGAGYSQDEKNGILRQDELNGLPITQDRINALNLTEDERNGIMQDPYDSRQFVRPRQMDALNHDAQKNIRGAYGDQAGRVRGSIDPAKLRVAGDYGSSQDATLNSSDAGVRDAIDPTRLRQDAGVGDRVRMTDRDVQDYQDRASRNVHNQKQAALDDIEQRAVSSGNVSPLAMGALRARYEQGAQVNSADAALDARLSAKNAQAQREMDLEQNRQSAEQGYAGLRSNAEMDMGSRRSSELTNREGMRLDAERGVTDRNLQTEQAIGDRAIQAEQGIQRDNLDSEKFNQQFGSNVYRDTGNDASGRAATVATNRQNVGMYGEDQRFNQGFATNQAAAQRNAGVADARRTDQAEGRGWLTNQQKMSNDNTNNAYDRRIQTYGAQNNAMGQATGTNAQYDLARRGQSFGTNFKTSLGRSLGNFVVNGAAGGH